MLRRRTLGVGPCLFLVVAAQMSACSSDENALDPGADSQSGTGGGGAEPEPGAGSGGDTAPVGDANEDDPQRSIDVSTVLDFPTGIAVVSPMSGRPSAMQPPPGPPPNGTNPGPPNPNPNMNRSGFRLLAAGAEPGAADAPRHAYAASASAIASVLRGEASIGSSFDPASFFVRAGNANCYGPSLAWQNHPDANGGDPTSGQFPGGDLGLWTASTQDGEACAAAQLNSRMRGVEAQVDMGLTGLAGLIAAYQDDGHSWPTDVSPGDSVDLTAAMNAAGIASVTFGAASMSLDPTGDVWSYTLELDSGSGPQAKHIGIQLQHAVTSREGGEFEGLLTYVIEDRYPDRNCAGSSSHDVSVNGSVHYIKGALAALVLQARNATACGHARSAAAANLLSDPITSTVLSGNAVDPRGAWADDFNVFTAEFDPETLEGSYSYAWQAGSGDGNTRVLDVGMETDASGEAYFGFGDRVQTSLDAEIHGFICNWAGPGNQHSGPDFAKYAQRQFMTRDTTSGRFMVADASASDITYAPTNSCMYDGAGSFVYDRNVDQSLSDDDASTAAVMASGTTLGFDLMTVADGEASIWAHILNRGYDLPSYP